MNVIFCTNLPSPYRVDFFNEFGKYCDLTVLYERHYSDERDRAWRGAAAVNFKEVYLDLKLVGVDHAKGNALMVYIKTHPSDRLIFTNYVSPATMKAILWCRLHHREYYIEYDGGFNKKDSFIKVIFKKLLLRGAVGHLTTAEEHIDFLKGLSIPPTRIFKYPFTSVRECDIIRANDITKQIKEQLKQKLNITEDKVVLSVGRFSYDQGYGKGYDVLLKVAAQCRDSVGFYIVGDEPTAEFVKMRENMSLNHVHYVGFKNKELLADYYLAADLFVLLSRGDVWGLVVNEAMSFGLPVISSDKCVAGIELVRDGENGYVVNLKDVSSISQRINTILGSEELRDKMKSNSLETIKDYTIEQMAKVHKNILL